MRFEQELKTRSLDAAKEIVVSLNKTTPRNRTAQAVFWALVAQPLKDYVDSWIEAGFNFDKWAKRDEFLSALNTGTHIGIEGSPPQFTITSTEHEDANKELALRFAQFITGPFFDKIGQCRYCGKYFLNKTSHRKLYCSRKCATTDSALKATGRKREEERDAKVEAARTAIVSFLALPQSIRDAKLPDWKAWVAKKAKVTPEFITQSINRGRLEYDHNLNERKRT
jgi:hypothetical protein